MTDHEQDILTQGKRFLEQARLSHGKAGYLSNWLQGLLHRLNENRDFQVRALHFIDVLPTVSSHQDILSLFHAYLNPDEFPLPGLGRFLLKSSRLLGDQALAKAIIKAIELMASQFMIKNEASEISRLIRSMHDHSRSVTLDLLGELTVSNREAMAYRDAYLTLLDQMASLPNDDLQCSVKVSSLYPRLTTCDPKASSQAILHQLRPILSRAMHAGIGITLDMEDYDRRPVINCVFEEILFDPEFRHWSGIGIVQQTYLRESLTDIKHWVALAEQRGTAFSIRLVRGAYWDQEVILARQHHWPVPLWQRQSETDRAYEQCLQLLFNAIPAIQLAIATHNPRSIALAMAELERHPASQDHVEFQMLHGMVSDYQQALVDLGYPLRIYIPFGELIPGMAYLVRRLLENASSQSIERLMNPGQQITDMNLLQPVEDKGEIPPSGEDGFINCPPRRFTDVQERLDLADAITQVQQQLGQDYGLLINGRTIETRTQILSMNPANPEQLVGRSASADHAAADLAIQTARDNLQDWKRTPLVERSRLLRRAAEALSQQRDQFAAWEILEAGKNWQEADADVCEAIDFLNYYADQAERLLADRLAGVPGESNLLRQHPRGIGLVIPPWNFPLAILTGLLSATLVSGNCAILKPASDTPIVAAQFVRLLIASGFPPGVIGLLPGPGQDVGHYLVQHPDVHLIAFTGSLAVGTEILASAASLIPGQRHIKKVIAELGGKNAIIVDTSADPDEAITGILQSAFGFQGQKCSACSRVIIVGNQYQGFCQRLAEATASLTIADPVQPNSDVGPVINAPARQRILHTIEQGKTRARLLYQADVSAMASGHYVPPSLFSHVDPNSPLAQEEIFGPVVSLIKATDLDQAIQIANQTRYALTGGIYSRHPESLNQARKDLHVGNLYLNRGITGALVGRQPFGGFRLSGSGDKAGGEDYLLQFVETQCQTENTLRRGIAADD